MDKLVIYKIQSDYVNYLKGFESNICHPKDFGHTRPYVGILAFSTSSFYYFAPLTSQINKPDFYCVKLFGQNHKPIAGVRINNMIPIPKDKNLFKEFKYQQLLDSENVDDVRYGNLIKQELASLADKNISKSIIKKAKYFYNGYKFNPNIRKISNNFKLLEQKSVQYKEDGANNQKE